MKKVYKNKYRVVMKQITYYQTEKSLLIDITTITSTPPMVDAILYDVILTKIIANINQSL